MCVLPSLIPCWSSDPDMIMESPQQSICRRHLFPVIDVYLYVLASVERQNKKEISLTGGLVKILSEDFLQL